MKVVTADMRTVRRLRRDAERAARGAPPRRRFGPHPSGLLTVGWSPARDDTEPRLFGADTPGVSTIAGRACVATADRTADITALPLLRVVVGPLPANPLPLQYAATTSAAVPAVPELIPVVEAAVEPLQSIEAEAVEAAPAAIAPVAAEPVAAEPLAAAEADPPPGPWSVVVPPPVAVQPAVPAAAEPTEAAVVPTPAAAPPERAVAVAAAAFAGPHRPSIATVPGMPPGTAPPREPMPSDLFAHALGLSPANNPAPLRTSFPDQPPPPRWSRFRDRPPREPGRGRLWLAAAGVVVLAGAGTAVGFAVAGGSSGDSPTTTSTSATAAVTGKIGAWLSANVTTDQRIVSTDPDLAKALNANGVPVDTSTADVEQREGVVVVGSADAQAAGVTAEGASRSLVTLAVFGSGGDTVAVGQVVDGSAESVRADLTSSASTAMAACKGLTANAAVTIDPAASTVFAAGELDLRVSTFLALIAQDQPITVVSVSQDPAERAAARPVRVVVVSVQNQATVRDSAATARAPYAPDVEAPGGGISAPAGSLVLSWPVDATAVLPVN